MRTALEHLNLHGMIVHVKIKGKAKKYPCWNKVQVLPSLCEMPQVHNHTELCFVRRAGAISLSRPTKPSHRTLKKKTC